MNYKLYINRFCKFFCVYLISTKLRGMPSSTHIKDVHIHIVFYIHCNTYSLLIALFECVFPYVCEFQAFFSEYFGNLKRKQKRGMFVKEN